MFGYEAEVLNVGKVLDMAIRVPYSFPLLRVFIGESPGNSVWSIMFPKMAYSESAAEERKFMSLLD